MRKHSYRLYGFLFVFLAALHGWSQCTESNATDGTVTSGSLLAQSFQVSCDGNITDVTVDIGAIAGGDNAITAADVYITTGNDPQAAQVGSALSGVTLTSGMTNTFDFSGSGVTVTNGSTYTLVIDDNGDADDFEVEVDAADPLSNGSFWSDGTTNVAGSDIDFSATVNDAPALTVPGAQAVNNNATLSFTTGNLISVADGDGDNQTITITVSNAGTLTLNALETGDLTGLSGDGTNSLSFGGTIADINEALDGAVYDPNGTVGAQTVSISTNDGNGGTDGPDVVNITVNQVPVITLPGAQTIQSPNTLTFTTGTLISLADGDGDNQTVTITVSNAGILTLNAAETGDLTGLSGDGTNSLSFGGTLTDINEALDGAVYDPNGTVGAQSITISTDDGNSGTDGPDVLNITVNQAPVITVPGAQAVNNNATLSFTTGNLISVADGDGDNQTITITVSNAGTLTLNALETGDLTGLSGDGTNSLSFGGTIADINEALDGAVYDPNGTVGAQTVSISTNDGNGGTDGPDVVNITVNQVPVITLPGAQTIQSPNTLTFTTGTLISLADGDGDNQTVTITVSNAGILTLNAAETGDLTGLSGDGTNSLSFGGTLTDINEALDGAVYDPNGTVGAQSITISTDDGNSGTDGPDVLNITVNQAPVITVPGAQAVNNNATLTFTTGNLISVADGDGDNQTITITVSNAGTLTLNALETGDLTGLSGDGTNSLSFGGTIADINEALDGAVYDPNGTVGAQTVSISTNDGNGGTDGPDVVNIIVNQVPVITLPGAQTIQSPNTLTFTTGTLISLADGDGDNQTVTITVSNAGTLTLNAAETGDLTGLSGDGTNSLSFGGTLTDINEALDGAVYDPNGTVGAQSITISTDDGNSGTDGPDVLNITVNQAPVLTVPGAQTIASNQTFTFTTGNLLTVADADGDNQTITITVSNAGTLTLNAAETGDLTGLSGDGTNSLSFGGTIADINEALDGAVYDPNGTVGAQTVSISTNDGNGGTDGPDVVNFSVTPYIVAAYFYDDGEDGIDEMVIELSEDINESSVEASDFGLTGGTLGVFSNFASGNIDNPVDVSATDEFITFEVTTAANTTAVTGLAATYTTSGGTDIASNATGLSAPSDADLTEEDRAAPIIVSQTLDATNAFLAVTFSEPLYTSGGLALSEVGAEFTLNFSQNGGTATNIDIDSYAQSDNITATAAGDALIHFQLSTTGVPDGNELIQLEPTTGSSVFDDGTPRNAMSGTQTTGNISVNAVNAADIPVFVAGYPSTDNSFIIIEYSIAVDDIFGAGTGDLEIRTSGGDPDNPELRTGNFMQNGGGSTGVTATNQSMTDASGAAQPGGGTTWRFTPNLSMGTPTGVETFDVFPKDGSEVYGSATNQAQSASDVITITLADEFGEDFDDAVATARDQDGDGNIDEVEIVMPDGVDDNTVEPGDFDFNGSIGQSFDTGTTPNDNTFTIGFTDYVGTAVVGSLDYQAARSGSLSMLDDAEYSTYEGIVVGYNGTRGNVIDDGTLTLGTGSPGDIIDGAGPVVQSATTADNDLNGEIDELTVTFSEPFSDISIDDTDFTLTDGYTIPAAGFSVSSPDVVLTLDESGDFDTDVVPSVNVLNAGILQDAASAGNPTQTFTNVSDGAAPYSDVDVLSTSIIDPQITGFIDDVNASVLVSVGSNTVAATNNGDRTWTLPAGSLTNDLSPVLSPYDVVLTTIDQAANIGTDATVNELTITGGVVITPAALETMCIGDDFQLIANPIVLAEAASTPGGFSSSGNIILSLPVGFEFDITQTPDFATGSTYSGDLSVDQETSTDPEQTQFAGAGSLSIEIDVTGTSGQDEIYISNLWVRAVGPEAAAETMYRSGGDLTISVGTDTYATFTSNAAPAALTSLEETSDPGTPITTYAAKYVPIIRVVYPLGPIFTNGEEVVFSGGATGTMVPGSNTGTQLDVYLLSGTVETAETFTGQTSAAVGTVTTVTGIGENLFAFELEADPSPSPTIRWYDGAGALINSANANTNTALSATSPGLYTYDVVTFDGTTCESTPLRFNVLVYSDVHTDQNENTFVDRSYSVTDDADTLFLSNPAGHTVNVTGDGLSVVGGGSDPLLAIFDPAVAGDNGGVGQDHIITYTVTNNTTGESESVSVTLTVSPIIEFFLQAPENLAISDLPFTLTLNPAPYGPNPATDRQFEWGYYRQWLQGEDDVFGWYRPEELDTSPPVGEYPWGEDFALTLDSLDDGGNTVIPLTTLGPGEGTVFQFYKRSRNPDGTQLVEYDYVFMYDEPLVDLTNVATQYCESDETVITLNREGRYVSSYSEVSPGVATTKWTKNYTNFSGDITNGYLLIYSADGSFTSPDSLNFTSATIGTIPALGISNTFDPRDPDQDGNDFRDEDETGTYRLVYFTEPLTPVNQVGSVTYQFTLNPITTTPALVEDSGGSSGTVTITPPSVEVDGDGYLLEYCVGDPSVNFSTADPNYIRWYNSSFGLVAQGVNSVAPGTVGVALSPSNRFTEQSTVFYFTATDGTGCESDFRQVQVEVYPIPAAPNVDLGSFPAEADQGSTYWFEYCIPKSGGGVDPDNIVFDPLNAGEEYVVEQTFYFDSEVTGGSGFQYRFNVSSVVSTWSYGDQVTIPLATSGTASGFVYSLSGSELRLILNSPSHTFNPGVVITNVTSTGTATGNNYETQYSLASNFINVPVLSSTGFLNYFLYTVSKTENINSSSNFAGCNGESVRVYAIGWEQPTDVTVDDLQDGVLEYHVAEGEALNNINHVTDLGMDGYVWYEDAAKMDTVATLVNGGSMTQDILDDTKDDPLKQLQTTGGVTEDRGDDGVNDVYTYYVTRYDHENEGVNAGFPGCESQTATPVTVTVHAIQPQPTVVSDNSGSVAGIPDFVDLNPGPNEDNSVDHFFSICVDQLESGLTLIASEATYGGSSREFRWYESDVGGARFSILSTDGSGTATFSELNLSGLNPTSTINRYFEVIQVTDNDVFEGTESESTFIRVDISPQDALEFRDDLTDLAFGDVFCRDNGSDLDVDLYAGTSPAGDANVTYQIDSYLQSIYDVAIARTATITHTASTAYTVGEIVVGGTSGASAEVVTSDGSSLDLINISGTFDVAEVITGASSGVVSTVITFTETTPSPDVATAVIPGNPTLDFDGLHDAVTGAQAIGGEATVHVITMTYTDDITLCEGIVTKVITVYPDPDVTILVGGLDIASFVVGSDQFCYEEGDISLQGALADGTPVTNGTFTSSARGALTSSNGSAQFNTTSEHNAFHVVTGTNGKFLNQSTITITFDYTDPTSGCDNSVDVVLNVNPEPEFYDVERVTTLDATDLAFGNASNFIRLTNLCNDGSALDAEIQLVDPDGSANAFESDYSAYTFTWLVNGETPTDIGTDGLNNTIRFVPDVSTLNFNVTVADPLGCTESFSETHSLTNLPSLEMTLDASSSAAAFEFCSDATSPTLDLLDNNPDLVVSGASIDPADVDSWTITSYNSSGSMIGVNNGAGAGTLPTMADLDLQTLHENTGGNTYASYGSSFRSVGGDTTYHVISITYTDPEITYQGGNTSCQSTVEETITIFPNPNVNFSIQFSGEEESFDDNLEFCYTVGGAGNITLEGVEIFPSYTISLNGGQVNQFLVDGNPVPTNNGNATINAAELLGDMFGVQTEFEIEYRYTDSKGCGHFFQKSIFINPLPEYDAVSGGSEDGDQIFFTEICNASGGSTDVEVRLIDPTDAGGTNLLSDYTGYTFDWTVGATNQQTVGDNTFSFVSSASEFSITVTATDPNGCQQTITETHSKQSLPDLNFPEIINLQEFCSDDDNVTLTLQDRVGGTTTVNAANVVSWEVLSYDTDQPDTAGTVSASWADATVAQDADGMSLPVIDLRTWHEGAGGNAYADFDGIFRSVGGNATVHTIYVTYQDPTRTYQGVTTMCETTYAETIVIQPNPDISFTLVGVDQDALQFCYDDESIALEGVFAGTSNTVGAGVFTIDGPPFSTNNGRAVIDADTYHGTNPYADQSIHTITYTYADNNGCEHTVFKDFLVNPRPQFVGDIDTEQDSFVDGIQVANSCETSEIEVFVEMVDGNENYSFAWRQGGEDVDASIDGNSTLIFQRIPGQTAYSFGVTATYIGDQFTTNCSVNSISNSFDIGFEPVPKFSWVGMTEGREIDFTIYQDNPSLSADEVELVELIVENDTVYRVETSTELPIIPSILRPDPYVFDAAGQYDVTVRMTTTSNCDVAETRTVNILPHLTAFNNSNAYVESFDGLDLTDPTDGWFREVRTEDGKEDTVFTSWVLDAAAPDIPAGAGNAIYSNYNTTLDGEISFVYSPSFDLSAANFTAPTISFDRYEVFESTRDGAILQYSTDDGRTWNVVGSYSQELADQSEELGSTPGWYNFEGITSAPGTQNLQGESLAPGLENVAGFGWAGKSGWDKAIAPLGVSSTYVRFRFALASQAGTKNGTGFGFDQVEIYNREQIVLLEVFSSSFDPASVDFMETVRTDGDFSGNDILTINYFTDLENGARLDPFNERASKEINAKTTFYRIDEVPYLAISGEANSVADDEELLLTNARLNNAKLNDPGFSITLTASETNDELIIDTDFVSNTTLEEDDEIGLFVAIVEPSVTLTTAVEAIPAGTELQNVLRKLLPNGAGKYVEGPVNPGQTLHLDTTWAISGLMNESSLRVIAFAQDLNTKTIFQATSVDVALTLDLPLGIDEQLANLEIYPNPADKHFTLEFAEQLTDEANWVLYDQSGREVLKGDLSIGTRSVDVRTDDLPSGLYLIHLYGEERKRQSRRVIVVH